MQTYSKYTPSFRSSKKGFTLLELLVVMTIVTIIMTTLVFQNKKWDDHLAVTTQAYEMALMIRQAQIYSIGVREYPTTLFGVDRFGYKYGVDTNITNSDRYKFFVKEGPGTTFSANVDPVLEEKFFTRGVKIDHLGYDNGNGTTLATQLDIAFFRPDPKAIITRDGINSPLPRPAFIYLISPYGKQVKITVEPNGQISVQ